MVPLWLREKPLADAVSNTGPIKLFTNPVLAGLSSVFFVAILGAVAMWFFVAGRGGGNGIAVFEPIRVAVIACLIIAFFIYMAILIEALRNPDGSNYRLFYVLGAMLGLGLFALTDWLAWDSVRAYLLTVERAI